MQYHLEIKNSFIKDARKIPKMQVEKVFESIKILQENLHGDIKKLTNYSPEYRLRVGKYRVLFEIKEDRIIIYRLLHRSNVYKPGA